MKPQALDHRIILKQGSFEKHRYCIHGHEHAADPRAAVHYISGYTGPEIEVTVDRVMPVAVLEVRPP